MQYGHFDGIFNFPASYGAYMSFFHAILVCFLPFIGC